MPITQTPPAKKQAQRAPERAAHGTQRRTTSQAHTHTRTRAQARTSAPVQSAQGRRIAQNAQRPAGTQGRTHQRPAEKTAKNGATAVEAAAARRKAAEAQLIAARRKEQEARAKKQQELAAKEAQKKLLAQKKALARKKAEEQKLLRKKEAEEKRREEEKQKALLRRAERQKQLAEKQKKAEERLAAKQKKAEEKRLEKERKAAIAAAKEPGPVLLFIRGLYNTSSANTEASKEKKRFPIFTIGTIALATLMFMFIVSSFMQISQIQADMKEMEATIRDLKAEERKLSMELEGKYSSKIESIAADMGLSGTYHKTFYLESDEEGNTVESVASDEAEAASTVNSLMSAFSRRFKKFLEFID